MLHPKSPYKRAPLYNNCCKSHSLICIVSATPRRSFNSVPAGSESDFPTPLPPLLSLYQTDGVTATSLAAQLLQSAEAELSLTHTHSRSLLSPAATLPMEKF